MGRVDSLERAIDSAVLEAEEGSPSYFLLVRIPVEISEAGVLFIEGVDPFGVVVILDPFDAVWNGHRLWVSYCELSIADGGHAVGDPKVCVTIDDLISKAMVEKMSSLLPSPFLKKPKYQCSIEWSII